MLAIAATGALGVGLTNGMIAVGIVFSPQLARLVPKAYREYFPGKDHCADGHFYLHDGTAWSFYKGDLLDD